MRVYKPGDPAPEFPEAKYPELERQKWAHEERNSRQLGDFLEWLESELGIELVPEEGRRPSTEQLLAMYFGIDLQKAERERRQILDSLQV